jgi:hypothetical protein
VPASYHQLTYIRPMRRNQSAMDWDFDF